MLKEIVEFDVRGPNGVELWFKLPLEERSNIVEHLSGSYEKNVAVLMLAAPNAEEASVPFKSWFTLESWEPLPSWSSTMQRIAICGRCAKTR